MVVSPLPSFYKLAGATHICMYVTEPLGAGFGKQSASARDTANLLSIETDFVERVIREDVKRQACPPLKRYASRIPAKRKRWMDAMHNVE